MLLHAVYTMRSEHQLMKQLDYNPLFFRLDPLSTDDPVSNVLDTDEIAAKFVVNALNLPLKGPVSGEQFSVFGTLIDS